MAAHALDADEQPVYFAGWEPLAVALGYPEPKPDSAAQRKVTRALKRLVDAGLIDADPSKPRHFKRRYRLNLPGP
jgi:DNA-binding transcriptional ArsR family regulator